MAILTGRTEADFGGGIERILFQSVAETAYDPQDTEISGPGEEHLEHDVALDVCPAGFLGVSGARLIEDFERFGGRLAVGGDLPWIRGDRGGERRCGGSWFGGRLSGGGRGGDSAESRGERVSGLSFPPGRVCRHGIERVARYLKFRCGRGGSGDGNRSKRAGPRRGGVGDGWGGGQSRCKDWSGRCRDGGGRGHRRLPGRRRSRASYRQFRRSRQIRGGRGRREVRRRRGRARRHQGQRQRRRLLRSARGSRTGYGRRHVQLRRHITRGLRLQRGTHLQDEQEDGEVNCDASRERGRPWSRRGLCFITILENEPDPKVSHTQSQNFHESPTAVGSIVYGLAGAPAPGDSH